MTIKRVGLYCHRSKPQVLALAKVISIRLKELGVLPIVLKQDEGEADCSGLVETRSEICSRSDALVVLGGDGTLLQAARDSYQYQIPILGVNLGNLGFLSETSTDTLDEQLQHLVRGDYRLSPRMALWVKVFRGAEESPVYESPVINEVLVFRRGTGRILDIQTQINEEYLTQYRADGLMVSTPTGSTGHSLSAGGPILKPEMRAILITPLCAHTLASRTIVVDEQDCVTIRIKPEDRDVSLTVDGQVDELLCGGDRLTVSSAQHSIMLISPGQLSFYELLRKKLYLGGISIAGQYETPPDKITL